LVLTLTLEETELYFTFLAGMRRVSSAARVL
jgi:hypothetical protein